MNPEAMDILSGSGSPLYNEVNDRGVLRYQAGLLPDSRVKSKIKVFGLIRRRFIG
jgi:hypothetical protein